MKKNFFRLVALGLLGVTIWACSDKFLESTPQNGTFTDASVFQTKADFNAYLFGAYSEMQGGGDGSGASQWLLYPGLIMQDITPVDEIGKVLPSFLVSGAGETRNYWTVLYKVIGRSNLILERIAVAPAKITTAEKTLIEGEAKFLRGFSYFMLARAFGNVPMPLASYTAEQNSLECTPEAKVWEQAVADFADAATKLPNRGGWGPENVGRATKGAALGYLAFAQMHRKDWPNAAKATTDLIGLGEYKLLPDVRAVFSAKVENTEESVFEVQYRAVDNGAFVWSGQPNNGQLMNEWTSPRNLGDQYAPFGGWGEGVMNKKLADSFEKGDLRRSKLVVAPGETYKGEAMTQAVTIPKNIAQSRSAFSTKYWLGPDKNYLGSQNLIQLRYAEVLLNYAEILFESGNPTAAYQQLNLVRKRAGLTDRAMSASREQFITDLLKERRWEFNFEPNLWFHYTRLGRAGKFLQDEYGISFNNSWNKLPIPQADRDQNPKLCQNDGY